MSDIFNPIGRSLPGFTGPTLVTGVVSDPPRSLLALAAGTILKGTVLGRGQDGLTTVATDKGTVKVATNAHLPTGSAVTLEVRNAGDRLQVLILSVDTSNGRSSPSHQPADQAHAGGSSSTGPAATGTSSNSAARGADRPAPAQPTPRPTGPPPIEIVGSSAKAIVVQSPPAASLLPTPDVEIEPFTPPNPPISVPDAAAQKAQILAQARLLLETPTTPSSPANPTSSPGGPAIPQPTGATPTPSPPTAGVPTTGTPTIAAPPMGIPQTSALVGTLLAATASPAPAAPNAPELTAQIAAASPQLPGTALQPEVAARIAALFAAAEENQPATGTVPTPAPQQATPAVPGSPSGAAPTAAGPLLAQILAANATAQPAALPAGAPVQALQAGTELSLHVVAVLPTKGGEIEIAPEAARLTGAVAPLIGKVLGYTRAGHAVIDTPAGTLMMQEKTRLPVGAQVALVLEPAIPTAAAALPPITSPQQALLLLSRGWPTLDDLLTVLRGFAPAPNDPSTPPPPGIPQAGPKLAAGLAAAITALRTGDVEKLLGSLLASRKLPADKDELVKRLKEEFAQLSDLAKDRPAVDWRALFLPVYDPNVGLTQINLYYRHNTGGGTEKEKKDQGTRFLVEVNFALLGAFQLDGLIRGKRFDLMIRSRRRLSRNQRQDIIGIFENALEVGGCTGGLEFRTVEVFPVSPLDELRQSHDHLTA